MHVYVLVCVTVYVHMTVLCACACVRACLSVMYAQGPLGNHRIWYDTTVTVFKVGLQQLEMFNYYFNLRGERYSYYLEFFFQQKYVTFWCFSIKAKVYMCVCVCVCVCAVCMCCVYVA